jgi:hypothetical protein
VIFTYNNNCELHNKRKGKNMKQQADNKTQELPEMKKRGRPSNGKALTAAQRKEDQFARDMGALAVGSYEQITNSGLIALLAKKSEVAYHRKIWEEIGRRKGFIV